MDFVWYNEPCLHFDLEDLYGRIQSFDQLEYYAEIFLHLNPDISNNLFTGMFVFCLIEKMERLLEHMEVQELPI